MVNHCIAVKNVCIVTENTLKQMNYPPRFNPYVFLKHVARVAMKLYSFQLPEI